MRDRAVQKTDDDASASKKSAVSRGYYKDSFISLFSRSTDYRLPLINIGTYCRVKAVDNVIDAFLAKYKDSETIQIVSLGAGSDTRPFHLLPAHENLIVHELDFKVQVKKKTRTILANGLQKLVGPRLEDSNANPEEYHSQRYHLHGQDLRQLDLPGLADVPTLVISECCLCYLGPEESGNVLEYFSKNINGPLWMVLYEPIGLDDEFGRVMAENLLQRGLCLPTFLKFSTIESQKDRLKDHGMTHVEAESIETFFENLDPADKKRIAKLEFLDEVEEMNLLLRHYCVAWGSRP